MKSFFRRTHFEVNIGLYWLKLRQKFNRIGCRFYSIFKVTIVDRDERDEQNLITRRAVGMRELYVDENRLTFHPNCGSHAAVINGGLTAHRPNAGDDFNFGVVLTSRPLKPNEIFEVRLDKMVSKWAGSIEIGK